MADETPRERLVRQIAELEDSISSSARGMQSVGRPGLNYTRLDPTAAMTLLYKYRRDLARLDGGGALIQMDIEGSVPSQVDLQDQFRNPDNPT